MLYLLRHGKTVRDSEFCTRPLSPRGHRQMVWLADMLDDVDFCPAHVLVSPALRARQTAAALCQRVLPGATLQLVDWMLPCDPAEPWVDRLSRHGYDALLVGHNPFMEDLALALTGKPHRFKTGALGAFDYDSGGRWRTAFFLSPPSGDLDELAARAGRLPESWELRPQPGSSG